MYIIFQKDKLDMTYKHRHGRQKSNCLRQMSLTVEYVLK